MVLFNHQKRNAAVYLALFFATIVSFSADARAYEEVPPVDFCIDGIETWGPGTVYVTGNVTVSDNCTLTVVPGTVVKFAPATQLNIFGTLTAVGVATDDIVITSRDDDAYGETISGSDGSPTAGDWRGIYTNGNSPNEGIANFSYVRIRYGGDPTGSPDANVLFYNADSGYFINSISEFSGNQGVRIAHAPQRLPIVTSSSTPRTACL